MTPTATPAPAAGTSTRAATILADEAALVHIFEVLTSTLWSSSRKANPYHQVHDNAPIDKTTDFFALDEGMLSGDIPLFSDVDKGIRQKDANGIEASFTLTRMEMHRLLAVAIFWDNVVARTVGGIPDVVEWYTLTDATLNATLRNAIDGQARVVPLPPTSTSGSTGTIERRVSLPEE
jgi:hypothetical protein